MTTATCYKYLPSEPGLWTVGFYDPSGKWISESDHSTSEEAANRAAWLNGSGTLDDRKIQSVITGLRYASRYMLSRVKAIHGNSKSVAWRRAIADMETELAASEAK